jgi:choline dehydrogenase-like flavoprotein
MLPWQSVILDLEALDQAPVQTADVCIIGAGAAGIALAVECSRLGLTVLLLEAGGARFEAASQSLYSSEIAGRPHTGIHDGRFRVFGGTTTRWGGQILELDPLDFEHRAWVPDSGWPIPKTELTAAYARALEIENVAPAILNDRAVWDAVHTPVPDVGPGLEPFFTRFCPQPDFAKLHRAFLETSPNVTVYLHANFCGFLLNEPAGAFTGVTCKTLAGQTHRFTARHYVLCAGAIETARLLLQPLAEDIAAPWNRSGLTGRFFQDHIDINVAKLVPIDHRAFHLWFDNIYLSGYRYIPKIKLSAQLQEEFGTLAVGASLHCQSARQSAVTGFRETLLALRRGGVKNLKAAQLLAVVPASDILIRKAWRRARHHRAYNPDDNGVDLRVHCEQAPHPDSRITLADDRDALGLFRTRLDWRIGELELMTVQKFANYAVQQFEAAGIARGTIYHESLENLEAFARHAVDTYHHMGTARMAVSADAGVVDPDCKLFGIDNGFVCSSAVFPTSGFSNPTHTILALAVRLAAHLARRQDRIL